MSKCCAKWIAKSGKYVGVLIPIEYKCIEAKYCPECGSPLKEWCECEKPYRFIFNPLNCDNCNKPIKPKENIERLSNKEWTMDKKGLPYKINEIIDKLNKE